MAITLGTQSNSGYQTGQTSITLSHAVAAGDDRILIVSVLCDHTSIGTVSSVKFDGTDLTQLKRQVCSTTKFAEIWYLAAPAVKTANIVVAFSGAMNRELVIAQVAYGASQDIVPESAGNASTSNSDPSTDIATVNPDSLVIDAVMSGSSSDLTASSGQTISAQATLNGMRGLMGYELVAGVGSNTSAYNGTDAPWAQAMAAFSPTPFGARIIFID